MQPQNQTETLVSPENQKSPQFPAGGILGNVAGSIVANAAPNSLNSVGPNSPNLAPLIPSLPEIAPLGSVEQRLANPETETGPHLGSGTTPTQAQPPQPPVIVQPTAAPINDFASTTDDSATPANAKDIDLIEKEWVAKAKKVISNTRNDPYMQEKQIAKLMRDYVKKRYGKIVGKAPEN